MSAYLIQLHELVMTQAASRLHHESFKRATVNGCTRNVSAGYFGSKEYK